MLTTDSQNLASQTRWLAILPINIMLKSEKTRALSLNLTKFDLPEVEIGSTTTSYAGYTVEIPTGVVNPGEKSVTFSYLLSSDLYQYRMLHKWVQILSNTNLTNYSEDVKTASDNNTPIRYPVTVVLLSEFKTPIVAIRYNDCWIKRFGQLQMDYQSSDEPVIHNFTLAYSNYDFIKPTDPSILL